jgi:hypothetical protein
MPADVSRLSRTDGSARDVGLDGGDDLDAVLLAEPVGEAEPPGKLVDRVDLGVHAEREGVDLDPPLGDPAEELVAGGPGRAASHRWRG